MTSLENHEEIFDAVLQPETNPGEKTCSETNVLQESRPPYSYYDLIIMALRSSPGLYLNCLKNNAIISLLFQSYLF